MTFVIVSIETAGGTIGAVSRDERLADRAVIRSNGTAIGWRGETLHLSPRIELEDFDRNEDMIFEHGASGWSLIERRPWPEGTS